MCLEAPSYQAGGVLTGVNRGRMILYHRSNRNYWHTEWFSKAQFVKAFSRPIRRGLGRLARCINTPWNQPTNFSSKLGLQKHRECSFFSPFELPVLQHHVSRKDECRSAMISERILTGFAKFHRIVRGHNFRTACRIEELSSPLFRFLRGLSFARISL